MSITLEAIISDIQFFVIIHSMVDGILASGDGTEIHGFGEHILGDGLVRHGGLTGHGGGPCTQQSTIRIKS